MVILFLFAKIRKGGENRYMEMKEYYRQYREKNADRLRAYQREYRQNNPERVRQWRRNAILNAAHRIQEQEAAGDA